MNWTRMTGLVILLLIGLFALSQAATINVDDTVPDKVIKTLAGIAALAQCVGTVIVAIIEWSTWVGSNQYGVDE